MAFVYEDARFRYILRMMNTNIDGRHKVQFALRAIKGCGRRFANVICKKANVDTNKRAGELDDVEIQNIQHAIDAPTLHGIPNWMLNRQKDYFDATYTQITSNQIDNALREDIERLKKMRLHRGLRHYWHLRVRGQHTCTTGRHGATIGLLGKKEKKE